MNIIKCSRLVDKKRQRKVFISRLNTYRANHSPIRGPGYFSLKTPVAALKNRERYISLSVKGQEENHSEMKMNRKIASRLWIEIPATFQQSHKHTRHTFMGKNKSVVIFNIPFRWEKCWPIELTENAEVNQQILFGTQKACSDIILRKSIFFAFLLFKQQPRLKLE